MTSAGPRHEPFADRFRSRNLAYTRASLPAKAVGDQPAVIQPTGQSAALAAVLAEPLWSVHTDSAAERKGKLRACHVMSLPPSDKGWRT